MDQQGSPKRLTLEKIKDQIKQLKIQSTSSQLILETEKRVTMTEHLLCAGAELGTFTLGCPLTHDLRCKHREETQGCLAGRGVVRAQVCIWGRVLAGVPE